MQRHAHALLLLAAGCAHTISQHTLCMPGQGANCGVKRVWYGIMVWAGLTWLLQEGALPPLLLLLTGGCEEEQTHACRLMAILAQAVPTHGLFREHMVRHA